jgi:O-antigen/teichoic acid export membrane protein
LSGTSFARGFVYTLATNGMVLLFGVAASVFAARLLGPAAFGTYSLALLFAYLVSTFTNLGLAPATVYHVSAARYPLVEVVANTLLLSVAVGLSGAALGAGLALVAGERLLPGLPLRLALLAMAMVPTVHLLTNLRSVFLGLQRFGVLSLALAGEAGLKAVLIGGTLLFLGGGVTTAVVANLTGTLVIVLALLALVARSVHGSRRVNRAFLGDSIRYGSQAYLGNALQFLNYRVDMLILNLWHGPLLVGYYSISVLFAERLNMISGAASTVLFPKVAASGGSETATASVSRVVFFTSLCAALVFLAVSQLLVTVLYGARFEDAVRPLQLLLPGMVALSVVDVIAHDFSGRGRPLVNSWLAAATLVANVSLCLVMIPRMGAAGAALSTSIAYSLQAVIALLWHHRVTGNTPAAMLLLRGSDVRQLAGLLRRRPAPASPS